MAPAKVDRPVLILPTAEGRILGTCGVALRRTVGQVSTITLVLKSRVPDGTSFWVVLGGTNPYQTPYDLGWVTFVAGRASTVVEGPASWTGLHFSVFDPNFTVVASSSTVP